MYNKMTGLVLPDTVQIRPAHADELEQIFMMRIVAGYQKDLHQPFPPLDVLRKIYANGEHQNMERDWSQTGAQFFVANVPYHEVTPVIMDHKGKALAGYCSVRYDPESNPDVFYFENLYTPKSDYRIGSMLMAHCIHEAQNSEAERIRFSAPYNQSQQWYENLGFETTHHIKETGLKIMELKIENASDVLTKLYDKINTQSASPKPQQG